MLTAKLLTIEGIVQGVGFRPFVYGLAKRFDIKGEIANTSSGVLLRIEAEEDRIDAFCTALSKTPPPLAQITRISILSETLRNYSDFSIVRSQSHADRSALISPDVAICEDCLREMNDPKDRRYHYPFINCTNCGPRYTIISDIPYDRTNTSMKEFRMCPQCQAEYDNPENRRFHAQPNACADCGPHVKLYDTRKNEISGGNPIETTAKLLKDGYIIAIKGLGGFHLAVDAQNDAAVIHLRQRKFREEKPFALMCESLNHIKLFAHIRPEEETLLCSPQRPIVLLEKKEPNPISPSAAPNNRYFGVMLPYTPLHYLLLHHFARYTLHVALVMTSANSSDEPIVIGNEEAFERLGNIADYLLIHNRDIYLRSDDSIVRIADDQPRLIRRSRGYVPVPIFLNKKVPQILACGAELKNTICLTKENRSFISQHIGDLENPMAYSFFRQTIGHLETILNIQPQIIAHDLHPDYFSTVYASEQSDIPKIAVQHHHAHIASCMAEHGLDGQVIGIACDGTGLGTDGNLWGCEILIADYKSFHRAAHLNYIPMPGSAAAIREPWRMAIAYLYDAFGEELWRLDLPMLGQCDEQKIKIVVQMIQKKVNCPMSSGLGRFFDAVAAIAGIRSHVCFEGQAAMELEMISTPTESHYDFSLLTSHFPFLIQTAPILRSIVSDIRHGISLSDIGSKFHTMLIHIFVYICEIVRKESGLNRVVLSGGSFQNVLLLSGLHKALEKKDFQVFSHRLVPTNDGGISLGQALIAASALRL